MSTGPMTGINEFSQSTRLVDNEPRSWSDVLEQASQNAKIRSQTIERRTLRPRFFSQSRQSILLSREVLHQF
jgi:hypothetical protein